MAAEVSALATKGDRTDPLYHQSREEEREGRSCKRVASRGSCDSVVGQILVVS
jgi:hypothetical protein